MYDLETVAVSGTTGLETEIISLTSLQVLWYHNE